MKIVPPVSITVQFSGQEVYEALIDLMTKRGYTFPYEYSETTLKSGEGANNMAIIFQGVRAVKI